MIASSDELLISRSRTFRSRRAFAASSFRRSKAPCSPFVLVGLWGVGEFSADRASVGKTGADATLSADEPLLTVRFSLWSGLGVIDGKSFEGIFRRDATESMEDKLALLACPCLTMEDAALDCLLERPCVEPET